MVIRSGSSKSSAGYASLYFGKSFKAGKGDFFSTKSAFPILPIGDSSQGILHLEFLPLFPSAHFKNQLLILHGFHSRKTTQPLVRFDGGSRIFASPKILVYFLSQILEFLSQKLDFLVFHCIKGLNGIIAEQGARSTVFNRYLKIFFLILGLEILETSRFLGHSVGMNKFLPLIFGFLFVQFSFAADDETCAIMAGDEIDPEEFSEVAGKKIFFCCGSCVKAFDANTAYYIKALPALAKKFSPAEQKKLGVDKVKLMAQRYCPIYPERIVNPNSKVEVYKGKKIYFWSSSAVRRWKRDPDKYFAEAVKRGHLKG